MFRRDSPWSKFSRLAKEIEDGNREARERDQDRAGKEPDKSTREDPLITIFSKPDAIKPLSRAELDQLLVPPISLPADMEKAVEIPSPEVPTYIEPVVGWRGWVINRHGILHSAYSHDSHYYPRVSFDKPTPSICLRYKSSYSTDEEEHAAPWFKCNCGYHMGRYEHQAFLSFSTSKGEGGRWPAAIGQAKLWGKVIEHEGGWRGEFVYPVELNLIPNPSGGSDSDWLYTVEGMKRVANRCSLLYDISVNVMDQEDWLDLCTASRLRQVDDEKEKT